MLFRCRALVISLGCLIPIVPAYSATIDAAGVYHFRVNSGVNSAGFGVSDVLTFGILASPNGYGEDAGTPVFDEFGVQAPPTTITATQNGLVQTLVFEGDPRDPNLYSGGILYDPSFTGQWTLELTNGGDTLTVVTPEVGDVGIPARVTGVSLSQSGDPTAPTIAWINEEQNADAVRVEVFDLAARDLTGQAIQVFGSPSLRNGESSFSIPSGILKEDGLYSIRIETRFERSSGISDTGDSLVGSTLSVNRTWFDFTTGDLPTDTAIYLPETSTGEDGNPVFNFNNPVLANRIEYYDPIVAIGYDYRIGEGDPFFYSFLLPEVGDNLYELWLWDSSLSQYFFEEVVGSSIEYIFSDGGVDRFRILGIEPSAGLDPKDPTAFVTGLSFVSDGRFTGTMTPVVEKVAPIPLPATLPLLIGGLCAFFVTTRRRRYTV